MTTAPVSCDTAERIIKLASLHLGKAAMTSSAALCLTDATNALNRGEYLHARIRGLKSLQYSVGILHYDYQKANSW